MINPALTGGILIALASSLLLLSIGRISGISGIMAQSLFSKFSKENSWRYFFILGLVFSSIIMNISSPEYFNFKINSSPVVLIISGLLVGFGTRLGSGCTSGHGVCGLSRLSKRSFIAVLTFMLFGVLSVYLMRFFI